MSTFRTAIALVLVIGVFGSTAGQAAAENEFLNSSVPVLSDPDLDQNAGDFAFAQTDSGEAIAFWGQSNGMFASIRPAGGNFGIPLLVSANGSGTGLPQISMAPNGHAVVVWRGTVLGVSQVLSATRPVGGGGFNPTIQVSFEPFSVPAVKPQVDVADDGSAVVAWRGYDVDGDENSSRIRRRFLDPAGELDGAITNVSPVAVDGVDFPRVAMGPNGHSLVSWVIGDVFTGDQGTIWAGPDGATPDVETFDTNSGGLIRAVVDSTGLSLITFKDGTNITGNRRPAGAGQNFIFDQALRLPATQGFSPEIVMDATGKATVAFPDFAGGQWGVQTVDRPAGPDTFFGTTVKNVSGLDDLERLSLAVGADGTVMQGWTQGDGRVYGTVRDAGAVAFDEVTGPVSPPIETGAVRAAVDAEGKGILAYSNSTAPAEDFTIAARPYDDVPVAEDLSIPATGVVGTPVAFSVAGVDPWVGSLTFEWDFGGWSHFTWPVSESHLFDPRHEECLGQADRRRWQYEHRYR